MFGMHKDLETMWEIYFRAAGIGVRGSYRPPESRPDYLILPEFGAACVVVDKGDAISDEWICRVAKDCEQSTVIVLDGAPAYELPEGHR